MINVTDGAAKELKQKLEEMEKPDSSLRLLYRGFG
jgi:hypothetical protein